MQDLSQADIERFWNRVDRSGGPDACWFWLSNSKPGNGPSHKLIVVKSSYGSFISDTGHQYQAHRLSYTIAYGLIPKGLYILHECDTPACVNPAHLRAGTQSENMADAWKRGRFRLRFASTWNKKYLEDQESDSSISSTENCFPQAGFVEGFEVTSPKMRSASKPLNTVVPVSFRLPANMARQIEQLADREYRSLHGQILYLIQRGLEAEREAERRKAEREE